MVLAKYSPAGAHLWSKRFGNIGSEFPKAIALDTNGNILVVGSFTGVADVGGGLMTSAGGQDIFIAKYSSAGVPQWVRQFGTTTDDGANSIAVDRNGNVVITGYFS